MYDMDIIVLTKHYQYWCETTVRKVIKWLVLDKIDVVEYHNDFEIRAIKTRLPLVVRLRNFIGYRARHEQVQFSEHAVYDRDDNICQYWHYDANGQRFKYRCTVLDRTIDHITPKSMGGTNSFDNCVCACRQCNTRIKKNRRPEDAGIELLRPPFVPTRRRGDLVVSRFVYDERKPAHRVYARKFNLQHPASEPASMYQQVLTNGLSCTAA